jgi:hypothetical protein
MGHGSFLMKDFVVYLLSTYETKFKCLEFVLSSINYVRMQDGRAQRRNTINPFSADVANKRRLGAAPMLPFGDLTG